MEIPNTHPLNNPSTRKRLIECILADRPELFREALKQECPTLTTGPRVFGVFKMGPTGMQVIMVDAEGRRLGPGDKLEIGVPVDILNLDFEGDKVKVTDDGNVWELPREVFLNAFKMQLR